MITVLALSLALVNARCPIIVVHVPFEHVAFYVSRMVKAGDNAPMPSEVCIPPAGRRAQPGEIVKCATCRKVLYWHGSDIRFVDARELLMLARKHALRKRFTR